MDRCAGMAASMRGHFSPGPPLAFSETPATWLLPGVPAAAVTHAAAGWVAVLCRTPSGGTVVHIRDAVRGRVIQERVPLPRPNEQLEPVALALAADGAALFAVLNDSDAASDTDEGRCWVAALDARSFPPLVPPVALPGTVPARDALVLSGYRACWIASRSPSAGFAFLHQLVRAGDHYEIRERQSYSGLSRGLVVAASSEGASVAVSIDRRVELWVGGKPGGRPFFSMLQYRRCVGWRYVARWRSEPGTRGCRRSQRAMDDSAANRADSGVAGVDDAVAAGTFCRFGQRSIGRRGRSAARGGVAVARCAGGDCVARTGGGDGSAGGAYRFCKRPGRDLARGFRRGQRAVVAPVSAAGARSGVVRNGHRSDAIDARGRNARCNYVDDVGTGGSGEAAGSPPRIAVRVTPLSEAARDVLWLSAGQNGRGWD